MSCAERANLWIIEHIDVIVGYGFVVRKGANVIIQLVRHIS